jgi:hypothetical protein
MIRRILCSALALVAGSAIAVHADPKDDVTGATQKLADSANYSWTMTTENANGGGFTPGPQEGKTEKDGYTTLSLSFGDNTTLIVMKGGKAAIQTQDGWKSSEELLSPDAQPGPETFMARMASNFKAPAAQITDIVSKLTAVTASDDGYSADLTQEQAQQQMTFGRGRRGGNGGQPPPPPANAKGSVKFWIKDGVLTKYQVHLTGTVSFGGNDMDLDTTRTTEFKDVGSTTITVPDDAKAKLGS